MSYRRMEDGKMRMEKAETGNGKVGMADAPAKQYLVRRSKKLPLWLWVSIAASLGIRTRHNDRAVLATILYLVTVLSALGLVVTTFVYVIASFIQAHKRVLAMKAASKAPLSDEHADMMEGIVMITLTIFWCLLGMYAKNLAYRLYSSAKFLDMVRLHAKTVLKVNAAFVFFLLLMTLVAVNNVEAYYTWYTERVTCASVGISVIVCKVRFVFLCVFSLFAILWNSLVGMVLLSVCRTNTMGIRRFIQDLEKDALAYERERFGPNAPLGDLMWLSENDADQSSEGEDAESTVRRRFSSKVQESFNNNDQPVDPLQPVNLIKSPRSEPSIPRIIVTEPSPHRTTKEIESASPSPVAGYKYAPSTSTCYVIYGDKIETQQMSTAVILQRYWKLSCATRISSLTFQRWTTCVTTLCLMWVSIGLVQWLSSAPRPLQVVQVFIPLLILSLFCAAYAEVNAEGKRLLKCICPMEQRLAALYVMWQSPPQMTIFGMNLTYGTMGTVAAGLLLALASRVVLKQLGGGGS